MGEGEIICEVGAAICRGSSSYVRINWLQVSIKFIVGEGRSFVRNMTRDALLKGEKNACASKCAAAQSLCADSATYAAGEKCQ